MAEQQGKLNINGTEYNLEDLSDNAKAQFEGIRVADAELRHLKAKMALVQTARNAYIQALQIDLAED